METPSEDDTTGTATYYYHVGGVRVINDPNPQPYSSTSGGTNYFYASGNWGGSAPTGAFTVNGSTHIMTFSGYYSTYTYSSSTIEAEFFFANDDEVIFLGWWVYGWNDNGSDGGEDWSNIISDDLRFSTTLSGSYSSNLSSEGTIYYGLFYYGNETVTTSVYLDANGGTCNPNSIEVVPGRTYGYLPTPYRAGYTFEGWYYGDELVTSTSKTVNTLFNYSLVAHWTANTYYNYYRYRNSSGTATTGTAQTRTYGQSFTTRSSTYYSYYTSNGWSLYGWADSSSDTDRDFNVNTSVSNYNSTTGNIYLYAISQRTVSLVYNVNGGTGNISSTTGTQRWNQYGNRYSNPSLTVTSSAPTRTDYTFLGWSTSSTATTPTYQAGNIYSFSKAYNSSASVTLYAVWERATYNNYYRYRNSSGTATTSPAVIRTYGQAFTTPSTSAYSYYTSNGWSLYGWADSSSDTDRDFNVNTSVSNYNSTTGNIYLYAISQRTVNLVYNVNGGTGNISSTTGTQRWNMYGTTRTTVNLTVTSSAPTRTGYTFLGWSTSSTATTPTYQAGNIYSFSNAYNASASVTLYAVWEVNQYSVRIYAMTGISNITSPATTWYSDSIGRYKEVEVNYNTSYTVSVTTSAGYQFDRWTTTNSSTANASSTSATYTFTVGAQDYTLYAWGEGIVYTITLDKQSGSGGTNTIYLKYNTGWYSNSAATSSIVKVSVPTRAGFTFQGYYTGANGTGTQIINSNGEIISGRTTITTSNISLHANWSAKNPARYDSEKGYWYVEMGMYPQTRATQTEINGITNTNGETYTIDDQNVTSKIGVNNIEYCQYKGVWYKVEPVRYVLEGDYSAGNGYENANVLAIMEQVVYISEWSVENNGLDSKYIYTWNTSSDMFKNNSTLHNNLINNFWSESGLSVYKDSYNYIGTRTDFYVENFPEIDGTNTSETIPWGVTYLATSTRDLDTVFGSGNYGAEFSDLVYDILKNKGNNLMYWTRDVGSNLNTAECITRLGTVTQAKMQNFLGVRITVNVKTFGCL